MSRKVTVVAGPARSGKTSRLLDAYRRELADGQFGTALWLCPTNRGATDIGLQLVSPELPACFSPNLLTFDQFAARVLAASAPRMRPVSAIVVRWILRNLIADNVRAGRLEYFAEIAHTNGFLDLVVGFIRELKRLEIWPQELADAHGRQAGEKERQLTHLYEQYQERLLRHHLFDAQGQFWAARAVLREGRWGPFAALRHVFVDGFADFTRTEHDVLEILSSRVSSLTISLPLEPDTCRGDLFAKSVRTLEVLRQRHPKLAVEFMPRRTGPVAALSHLERHLFGHGKDVEPAPDDAGGIEVVPAAGVTDEIERIARRIKGLLMHGNGAAVVPGDILVVFRSLADAAPLVGEVFENYGIPCAIQSAPPLASASITAALVHWLRLDVENWPFRRVLALLGHNYFQPAWPERQEGRAAVALEHLVRDLDIASGRAELAGSIERLAARAAVASTAKKRLSEQLLRAQLAAPLVRKMCDAIDALPQRASPDEWAAALDEFGRSVGLFVAADDSPLGDDAATTDRLAWQRLTAVLGETERLSRWVGEPPPRWSRRELLAMLEDVLRSEPLPRIGDERGSVRVLSADAARNLAAPYVFLAGLSEKAFPPASREDCLLSDAERRRLADVGLPLSSHALDSRFEMLLFYEMVTRATRRLVLSYPALDPAAQPLTPSPYLREVEHACGEGRVESHPHPHLTSVPDDDDVRSPRDFRVRAVSRALEGDGALLAELCAHHATRQTADNVLAALGMSQARYRNESFGPFEGLLATRAALGKLAERFGPKRCWSPSHLEQYAYCPFQFYMQQVLHAEPVSEPALAIDYMERGRLLHGLLSTAHRRLNEMAGGPTTPGALERSQFLTIVEELIDQLRREARDRALESGLWEIDVRKILAWIDDYYDQHARYDEQWRDWHAPPRPAHFEVAFGPRPGDDDIGALERTLDKCDSLSTLDPFALACGDETILFAGRIDRIDLGHFGGQSIFSIVDYKSGKGSKRTSLKAVLAGNALQLPLYALATQWLLDSQQAVPFRAAYWHVGGRGYREGDALKHHDVAERRLEVSRLWRELEANLRVRVRSLVEGIRRGQFPMHSLDEQCTGRCAYHTVCRVNQVRSLGKSWQPPREEQP